MPNDDAGVAIAALVAAATGFALSMGFNWSGDASAVSGFLTGGFVLLVIRLAQREKAGNGYEGRLMMGQSVARTSSAKLVFFRMMGALALIATFALLFWAGNHLPKG